MMRNVEEMTITVNKSELLDILGANRKKHDLEFDKAIVGWAESAEGALRVRADKIKAGYDFKGQDLFFDLPKPTNHIEDYDNAIRMLGLHVEDTIEISFQFYRELFSL